MDRKKFAALISVPPTNHDSGRKRGYRQTKGDRAHVRSVFYMSTLAATRYNPLDETQYQHLLKRGKLGFVIAAAIQSAQGDIYETT